MINIKADVYKADVYYYCVVFCVVFYVGFWFVFCVVFCVVFYVGFWSVFWVVFCVEFCDYFDYDCDDVLQNWGKISAY